MSTSAFGIDHGEVSKGLPSAVKAGGGGSYGSLLRAKKYMGSVGAKHPSLRRRSAEQGRGFKEAVEHEGVVASANRSFKGKGTRQARAGLLNEDSAARRKGYKTGKTSALDRGYRGRVGNKMEALP